jgi:pimeloyl-ACP methyl ester carboxylesterase
MHATISRTILTVDGIRTPLLEVHPAGAPTDEAVVFVHGNPGSSQDWVPLLELAGHLARAVAWDHPGSAGPTSRPASTTPSTATPPTWATASTPSASPPPTWSATTSAARGCCAGQPATLTASPARP